MNETMKPVLVTTHAGLVIHVHICENAEDAEKQFTEECAEYGKEISDKELEDGYAEFDGGLHNQLDDLTVQLHWATYEEGYKKELINEF